MNNSEISVQVFLGSYSKPGDYFPNASGKGVVVATLELATGTLQEVSACPEAVNATYLAKSPDGKWLLVASDFYFEAGEVTAFRIGANGELTKSSSQSTHGTANCHVTISPDSRRVFATGYQNGKLSVHDFSEGQLSPANPLVTYEGSGPNPDRQEAAHAHQATASPDGHHLYVCDLGSDRVWIHDLNQMQASLDGVQAMDAPPGCGPRHLICHPTAPWVYVFTELSARILVCDRNTETGMLTMKSQIPTLPEDFEGTPSGAAIRLHPTCRALYVSNRQHDSITAFSVDPEDGTLSFLCRFPCGGQEPRDFGVDPTGQWLLAANQDSNTVVPFRLDPKTGCPTGEQANALDCSTPVCVLFLEAV